jgi:hypothetical protein
LDCGFFQPARPPCPNPLLPLDQHGRMRESPATTQKSIVSIQNTSSQVLDYSTRGAHLLRRSLGHLQLLGDSFARHIARPPWRHRETSLQASRWIFDKGDVGQPRPAEPGTQLELLLKRFTVLLIGRVFYGDGVITPANFTALLVFSLALLWNIHNSRRGSGVGDKLCQIILHQTVWVSSTTTMQ